MKRLDKFMLWSAAIGSIGGLVSCIISLLSSNYDLALAWFCTFCWASSYFVTIKKS
jgi:hypothetical protein